MTGRSSRRGEQGYIARWLATPVVPGSAALQIYAPGSTTPVR